MYERTYGPGYVEVYEQHATAADIARLIRRDLKAAVAAGEIPGKPVAYGVKVQNYSGGRSIDVTIRDYPGVTRCPECGGQKGRGSWAWAHDDACPTCITWDRWLHPDAQAIADAVEAIRQAYNYDGSDSMTDYYDVNYYGSTTFEDDYGRRTRLARRKSAADA